MKKKFKKLNDVGIEVEYTVLGVTDGNKDESYVVYTNYMPSDNPFGYRLLVSQLVDEETFELKRVSKAKQQEIIDSFIEELEIMGVNMKR